MRLITEIMTPFVVIGLVAATSHWSVQDQQDEAIEIVDQDGQKVDANRLKVRSEGDKLEVTVDDGKIVIIDEDGKRREIDVSGAQNIIVNKSVRSIIRDGQEHRKFSGKAIIIGPDGERQEIELGDNYEELGEFSIPLKGNGFLKMMPFFMSKGKEGGLPEKFAFGPSSAGKYMIGVVCKPVPDQLRVHLDLADDIGLVVTSEPGSETPAEQAGIAQHDILMYADQEELATIKDLVQAVQLAGREERELSLTVVRRGNEIGVDVKPVERKITKGNINVFFPEHGDLDFQVEQVGPGFLFKNEGGDEKAIPDGLLKHIEAMDELKARMEELMRMQDEFRKSIPDWQEKDDN